MHSDSITFEVDGEKIKMSLAMCRGVCPKETGALERAWREVKAVTLRGGSKLGIVKTALRVKKCYRDLLAALIKEHKENNRTIREVKVLIKQDENPKPAQKTFVITREIPKPVHKTFEVITKEIPKPVHKTFEVITKEIPKPPNKTYQVVTKEKADIPQPSDSTDPLIKIRRQWNDYRIGEIHFSQLSGLKWDRMSGGVNAIAPQYFIHGYVSCTDVKGEIGHSCTHGPPPHSIKVCITKKGNESNFKLLLDTVGPKPKKQK